MQPTQVFLGLGANLGDPGANLASALEQLQATPGVRVVRSTEPIETEPVDAPPGSPRFRNAVAELETSLAPRALLAVCQAIENRAGRDRGAERNAPRPIDLDILWFGGREIDERTLVVPHPRLFERAFVLEPLAELVDVAAWPRPERPLVLREPKAIAGYAEARKRGDCTIGLVPTMGALHDGHASLLRLARAECDRVIASVFVNPLQFAAGEDLDAYPRTFARDLEVLRATGVDAVFLPRVDGMYGAGFCSRVAVGKEAEAMEGATRPSHFEGVTTIVAKLFNLTRPDVAYFGQKDAQQVAVLRRMTADLSYPVELRVGPIVREADGLAMSSRNAYLTAEDRAAATVLIEAMRRAQRAFRGGLRDAAALLAMVREHVGTEPRARLDYLELRQPDDLLPLPDGPVEDGRLLLAAFFSAGETPVRLLDNLALSEDPA